MIPESVAFDLGNQAMQLSWSLDLAALAADALAVAPWLLFALAALITIYDTGNAPQRRSTRPTAAGRRRVASIARILRGRMPTPIGSEAGPRS